MSGQATGKRTHKPLRMRMYYDQSSELLIFDAKVGGVPAGTVEEVVRLWRRGTQLNAVIAVATGSEAQKAIIGGFKSLSGMDGELSEGGVTSFTRKVQGIKFVRATQVQPTPDQKSAAQAQNSGVAVFYNALCTNDGA